MSQWWNARPPNCRPFAAKVGEEKDGKPIVVRYEGKVPTGTDMYNALLTALEG